MAAKNLREGVELLVQDADSKRTAVYLVLGTRDVLRLLGEGSKIVIPLESYPIEASGMGKIDDVIISFVDDADALKRSLIEKARREGFQATHVDEHGAEYPILAVPPFTKH
jgi:hypothetical protein